MEAGWGARGLEIRPGTGIRWVGWLARVYFDTLTDCFFSL